MENEVFERDYTYLPPLHLTSQFQTDLAIIKHAADAGIIKEYEAAVKAMPRIIMPSKKVQYDDLLIRLNEFAMEARGAIRGVVDFEEWQASITVTLPTIRFIEPYGTLLMADVALSAEVVGISTDEKGAVQMVIELPYFQEIGNKEQIMDDLIDQDEELLEMIATLFSEE